MRFPKWATTTFLLKLSTNTEQTLKTWRVRNSFVSKHLYAEMLRGTTVNFPRCCGTHYVELRHHFRSSSEIPSLYGRMFRRPTGRFTWFYGAGEGQNLTRTYGTPFGIYGFPVTGKLQSGVARYAEGTAPYMIYSELRVSTGGAFLGTTGQATAVFTRSFGT